MHWRQKQARLPHCPAKPLTLPSQSPAVTRSVSHTLPWGYEPYLRHSGVQTWSKTPGSLSTLRLLAGVTRTLTAFISSGWDSSSTCFYAFFLVNKTWFLFKFVTSSSPLYNKGVSRKTSNILRLIFVLITQAHDQKQPIREHTYQLQITKTKSCPCLILRKWTLWFLCSCKSDMLGIFLP